MMQTPSWDTAEICVDSVRLYLSPTRVKSRNNNAPPFSRFRTTKSAVFADACEVASGWHLAPAQPQDRRDRTKLPV